MTKKEQFLRKFNEACAMNDTEFILENITADIQWEIVGDITVQGKQAFQDALVEMESEEPFVLTIPKVITHGDTAVVEDVMKSKENKSFAFCDIYRLNEFKYPKIKKLTSYVIELKTEPV